MIAKKTAALCAALALTAVLGVFPGHAAVLAASEKDDFYQAVNEKTLAEKQIKPTEASWSWFHERNLENKEFLTGEIEDIASHQGTYAKGTPEQKIADLYQCITDQKTRNATARKHIQDVLAPIKAARTPQELTAAVGELHQTYGIDVLMSMNEQRLPDSRRYVARFEPHDPFLSRYDLEKEPQPGAWKRHTDYISRLLQEDGTAKDKADTMAASILAYEKSLAPHMLTSEEENDIMVQNRMVTRKEFLEMTPHLDGKRLLKDWGLSREKVFFLSNPDYLCQIDAAYTDENLELMRNYFIARTYDMVAPFADIPLRDITKAYYNQRYGIKQNRTERERASYLLQDLLPYETGQIYLKKRCTPHMIQDVRAMTDEVRKVYRSRLEANAWMSPRTRAQAIEKLDALRVFVGGPAADDKPLIEDMHVVVPESEGGDLLGNILASLAWAAREEQNLIGTDFNPDKWYAFDPQDVNAAYISDNNSITIPAGILQPPFYDANASRGTNLGGIGAVIGHEISHAFDPNGSHTDKDGNVRNWWTKADYEAFQKRAAAFAPYYSRYELAPGQYENGKLVMNEAIADCGGLSAVTEIAAGDKTALQDLYRNFASIFASKYTDQLLHQLLMLDPHPEGRARVNGALSSTDGFYGAYDIATGDGMYIAEKDRVKLW